jgi:hypothetical protein
VKKIKSAGLLLLYIRYLSGLDIFTEAAVIR